VEQDYYARNVQLRSGTPAPLEPVAVDPWWSAVGEPDAGKQQVVRDWLRSGTWWLTGTWNPGPQRRDNPRLSIESTWPIVVVATAARAAFNAEVQCHYLGGIPGLDAAPEKTITAYVAGLADVAGGVVHAARGVVGRAGIQQALAPGPR
jgi:hypothetical protein